MTTDLERAARALLEQMGRAELDPEDRAVVDALQARLAAAEGLLREAREAFDCDAWDDPVWSMARRIDAHLAAAQPKPNKED